MKYWVGITDNDWFSRLAALKSDELNFWQPGGGINFKAVPVGAPVLFKLHSPLNYITGGGYFLRQSFLPVSLTWGIFGEKNGCKTFADFRNRMNDTVR